MSNASLNVIFGTRTTPDDDDTGADELQMELDDVANGDISTFEPGNTAYIRILHRSEVVYQAFSSEGTFTRTTADVLYPVVDELVEFAMSKEGTLGYYPYLLGDQMPTVEWETLEITGSEPDVIVQIDGDTVKLNTEVVGILKVSYVTLGDRWALAGIEDEGPVLTAAKPTEGSPVSLTVDWEYPEGEEPDEETGEHLYELRVIDYCTDDPVEGAAVTIGGSSYGTTNSDGIVYVGHLDPGEHTLVVTKSGYLDSDTDKLNNDAIIIEGT